VVSACYDRHCGVGCRNSRPRGEPTWSCRPVLDVRDGSSGRLFRRLGEIDRLARPAEQFLNHRLKGLERHRSEIGIEGDLIEQAAEFLGLLEMRMPTVLLAHIAIEPQEVEEIIPLKDIVMLDDPVVLLRHEGLDDHGRDVRVIVGPQRIADIVQQAADHIFLVSARLIRAGRGLQAMLQTIAGNPP
jgi:hypothetical protein